MSKVWFSQPPHLVLVEILQKKQGNLTDIELYNALKDHFDDLSFNLFNRTLMKLEIEGMVHVFNLTKNKRGVEMVKSLSSLQ